MTLDLIAHDHNEQIRCLICLCASIGVKISGSFLEPARGRENLLLLPFT